MSKTSYSKTLLACAALTVMAVPAIAASADFGAYDQDANGKITQAEFTERNKAENASQVFSQLDMDRNGDLSKQEFERLANLKPAAGDQENQPDEENWAQ